MPSNDRYVGMEKIVYTALSADATANYVDFTLPYAVTGVMVQVRTAAGLVNQTGLTITITGLVVRVAVTDLVLNDVISLIAFAQ